MVVYDSPKVDERGIKGAPDLIVEVLSPSTQSHDRVTKFNLYRRASWEYWLVDPESRVVQSFLLQNASMSPRPAADQTVWISVCWMGASLTWGTYSRRNRL